MRGVLAHSSYHEALEPAAIEPAVTRPTSPKAGDRGVRAVHSAVILLLQVSSTEVAACSGLLNAPKLSL